MTLQKLKTIKPTLKQYALLIPFSVALFLLSAILHNVFYALAVLTQHFPAVNKFFELLDVLFFLVSVPLSPILLLVGIAGAVIKLIKKKSA